MKFLHTQDSSGGNIIAYREDAPQGTNAFYQASSTHPNFAGILEALNSEDESVWDMFDVGAGLTARLRSISDRVSYDGKQVLWDGDPVHNVISDQIRRALEAGEQNYEALALFWEKLESNPEPHSKEQAYDFLAAHDFKITPEGDVVGYKGLHATSDGRYRSWHRSGVPGAPSAFVNGEAQPELDYVYQNVGDVVSMPRSEVVHDPTQACRRGLHVATFAYASGYGDAVGEVHFNPRDICSVPTDGGGEKVRVNRYKVAAIRTEEAQGASPVLSNNYAWSGVGYSG